MWIKIHCIWLTELRISCKIQLIDSATEREPLTERKWRKRTDRWTSEIDIDRRQASAGHRIIISFTKENDSVYAPAVQVSTTCYILYPVRMVGGGDFFSSSLPLSLSLSLPELGGRSSVCLSGERFSSGASFKSVAFYPPFPLFGQRTGRIVPRTKIASSKKYPRGRFSAPPPLLVIPSRSLRFIANSFILPLRTFALWIREINSPFIPFASFKGHWESRDWNRFYFPVWFILAS